MQPRRLVLVCGFALGLVFVGLLRIAAFRDAALTPYSGYATGMYIALTIAFAVMLGRSGVELRRFGFAQTPRWRHVALALAAVAFLQGRGRCWSRCSRPCWARAGISAASRASAMTCRDCWPCWR